MVRFTLVFLFAALAVHHAAGDLAEGCQGDKDCEDFVNDLKGSVIQCARCLGKNQCRSWGRCDAGVRKIKAVKDSNGDPDHLCHLSHWMHYSSMQRRCGECLMSKNWEAVNRAAAQAGKNAGICNGCSSPLFPGGCGRNVPTSRTISGNLHLANIGDRTFYNNGWLGYTGIGNRVEGFTLTWVGVDNNACRLEYMAHVANQGDTAWISEDQYVGTKGLGRAIEGLRIRLAGSCANALGVRYQCHLANRGNTAWRQNGEFCGTVGEGRALEAFRVEIYNK